MYNLTIISKVYQKRKVWGAKVERNLEIFDRFYNKKQLGSNLAREYGLTPNSLYRIARSVKKLADAVQGGDRK